MIAALLMLADVTTEQDYTVAWFCRSTKSQQDFTLSYEERANRISDVRVTVANIPVIHQDTRTRWRGKPVEGGVKFTFDAKSSGFWGEMELMREPNPAQKARLRWRDIVGVGSHIPLENEEQFADCFSSADARKAA